MNKCHRDKARENTKKNSFPKHFHISQGQVERELEITALENFHISQGQACSLKGIKYSFLKFSCLPNFSL